jgi:TolA-binding protein
MRLRALLLALLLWPGLAWGTPLLPLELPPHPLPPYLPLAAPPLEKPPVALSEPALPDPPRTVPPLPTPPLATHLLAKPTAPLTPPRLLACNPLGSVFGVASELLECGRARFQRDELEEARVALEDAVRRGIDRALLREARYWLGETLVRMGRYEAAERNFLLVVQEGAADEVTAYATYSLGWVALRLGDPGRALPRFEGLRRGAPVPALAPDVVHGRALALYGLGRFAEAREAWEGLARLAVPRALQVELAFWLGDTLGRLGLAQAAVEHLQRFTAAGAHPLIEAGILRLGWWSFAAGAPLESVKAYRWLLSAYPRTAERAWARLGLARALLALGDWPAARAEIAELGRQTPPDPLALPGLWLLARWAADKQAYAEAHALYQEILAAEGGATERAWVLLMDGVLYRREGRSAEARTQLERARAQVPGMAWEWLAALLLAQMDLEAREFERAAAEGAALLAQPLPPDLRVAALLLAGEARYWGREWEEAAAAYGRLLSEFPSHPQAGMIVLSLGWADFRRGLPAQARQRWEAFAHSFPDDPRAPEALLLAAEIAEEAGDPAARDLLDRLLARYPAYAQADLARLNRAILDVRAGRSLRAQDELAAFVARASTSPFLGRARLALGVALLAQGRAAEAARHFALALREGEGALAHLGAGQAALALRRWEDAAREFTAARDSGPASLAPLALYGLAAAALGQGRHDELATAGPALLASPPSPALVPPLLYTLAAVAVEGKRWEDARALTMRLATEHPASEPADDALFRLGAGAAAAGQWPLAREAYEHLEDRYPKSPLLEEGRMELGEALLRTGAPAPARRQLEAFVAARKGDPRLPRALFLLARAREAAGDRAAAIEAYARVAGEHGASEDAPTARLAQGRLLVEAGRWSEGRRALEQALGSADRGLSAQAAFLLGEGYRARGTHEEAAEAYMTAAYLAPDSSWGRRALAGAGRSFIALRQTEEAVVVFKKLLAQPDAEPELLREAREALAALGVSASAGGR